MSTSLLEPQWEPKWPPQKDLPLPDLLKMAFVPTAVIPLILANMSSGPRGLLVVICALFRYQSAWRYRPLGDPGAITREAAASDTALWAWKTLYGLGSLTWQRPETIGTPCLWCAISTGRWCEQCDDSLAAICSTCEDVAERNCPKCSETKALPVEVKPATVRLLTELRRILASEHIDATHWNRTRSCMV